MTTKQHSCRAIASVVASTWLPMAAAVLLPVAAAQTASAAPTTSQGYYEESKVKACSISSCVITFSTPPAGKTLIITNVSCLLTTSPSTIPLLALKIAGGGAATLRALNPIQRGSTSSGTRNFSSNDQMLAIFRPGEFPHVTASWQSSIGNGLNCSISGEIKP